MAGNRDKEVRRENIVIKRWDVNAVNREVVEQFIEDKLEIRIKVRIKERIIGKVVKWW